MSRKLFGSEGVYFRGQASTDYYDQKRQNQLLHACPKEYQRPENAAAQASTGGTTINNDTQGSYFSYSRGQKMPPKWPRPVNMLLKLVLGIFWYSQHVFMVLGGLNYGQNIDPGFRCLSWSLLYY